jgi:dihydroflavonol-4-reductase
VRTSGASGTATTASLLIAGRFRAGDALFADFYLSAAMLDVGQEVRHSVVSTMKPADVLITGATGFIGSAVARKLVGAGFAVRALMRPSSPRAHIADLDLEPCEGDLRDEGSIRSAMRGVRYVFHLAADYRLWARHPHEIFKVNVGGTRDVMQEALRTGVERVVYTSSVATLALRDDGGDADESRSMPERHAIGAYKRSKIAAEALVSRMAAEEGLPAVIVNPSAPVGPRDVRPTPTGRIIIEAARGRVPAFVDTGLNLVHVDDVAQGHFAALRHGKIGERYILGGQNVPFAKMLGDIAGLVGRRSPRIRVPHWAVLPVAYGSEAIACVTGHEPFATVEGARMSKHCMFFKTTKAEAELGYRSRPYIEGLKDAVCWFREAGYLRG